MIASWTNKPPMRMMVVEVYMAMIISWTNKQVAPALAWQPRIYFEIKFHVLVSKLGSVWPWQGNRLLTLRFWTRTWSHLKIFPLYRWMLVFLCLYFRCQIIIPPSSRNQGEFGSNSTGGRLVVFYISTDARFIGLLWSSHDILRLDRRIFFNSCSVWYFA